MRRLMRFLAALALSAVVIHCVSCSMFEADPPVLRDIPPPGYGVKQGRITAKERVAALDEHIQAARKVLDTIKMDLWSIAMSDEYNATKADKALLRSWKMIDGTVQDILSKAHYDLQSAAP